MDIFNNENRFEYLTPILKHVINLSIERDVQRKEPKNESLSSLEQLAYRGKELELCDYLCTINKDILLDILSIMYTGRDNTFEDEYGNYSLSQSRNLIKHLENEEQEHLAMQIYQKRPLTKYLINGANKIHLEI